MQELFNTANFEAIVDGNNVTSKLWSNMKVFQFRNITSGVIIPDYSEEKNQPTIYVVPMSQNDMGEIGVASNEQVWKYNGQPLSFDESGFSLVPEGVFMKTTHVVNGRKYPAIKIVKNLISDLNLDNDTIAFEGKAGVAGDYVNIYPSMDILIAETAGDPYMGAIDASNYGVITNANKSILLTALLYLGKGVVAKDVTYKWFQSTDKDWKELKSDKDAPAKLTVTDTMVESVSTFKCEFYHNGKLAAVTPIQIQDTTDPWKVHLALDGPTKMRKGDKTIITPSVVLSSTMEPIKEEFRYNYRLMNNSTLEEIRTATGDNFTMTYDEVKANAPGILLQVGAYVVKS